MPKYRIGGGILSEEHWQPPAQTGKMASRLKIGVIYGVMQGERTVFSTLSCIGGEQ